KRRPGGLLHFALARHQAFLHASIRTRERKNAAATVAARIDDHRTVRGIARRDVEAPLGEHLDIAASPQVHDGYVIGAILLGHEGELRLVRRQSRPRVVIALEGKAARVISRLDADSINLRTAGTV